MMKRTAMSAPNQIATLRTWKDSIASARQSGEPCHSTRSPAGSRSEEHTSELQSLMRISYAVFCLKKKTRAYIISFRMDGHTTKIQYSLCSCVVVLTFY